MRDMKSVTPGSKIGNATVTNVTHPKHPTPTGKKPRAAQSGPWGRTVSGDANRVTLAFSIPPRVLWPNGRSHWSVKSKAVKAHRSAAWEAASEAMERFGIGGGWEKARLTAAFWWPDLKPRDGDNARASLKAYQDGIVDAGLIAGDDTGRLSHGAASFDVDRANPRVELFIERL